VLTEQTHVLVDQLAKVLELVGVAMILGGIILATATFLRNGARGRLTEVLRMRNDCAELVSPCIFSLMSAETLCHGENR
jgi:hypothetical protein